MKDKAFEQAAADQEAAQSLENPTSEGAAIVALAAALNRIAAALEKRVPRKKRR